MKFNGKLKLSFEQKITHFLIIIFGILSFLLACYWLIEIYILKSSHMILERVVQILISSIVFSIVCFLIQNRKLYFREYNISYTEEQFQVALKKTAHELDWTIESNKKGSTRASRSSNWSGSWGEMITIIKRDNQILLNSICDPNLKSSVISWGWNNRNRKSFISNLQIATGQNK